MKVIIDGNEVEFELPRKEVLVREVVGEVEQFLFSHGRIPHSLKIDNKELTQEELDARENDMLTGNECFEFIAQGVFDFIVENIDGATQANQELTKQITEFADKVHSSPEQAEAGDLIGELEHFFQFWIRMQGLLDEHFQGLQFDGKNFIDHLEGMREILQEVLSAMEDKDWVLSADLLQYEMVPQIEVMDKVIPELRETLNKLAADERQNSQATT